MVPLIAWGAASVSGVLILAGLAKVVRPDPLTTFLRALGWPNRSWIVRTLGIIEVGVGLQVLIGQFSALILVQLLIFASFGLVLIVARRKKTSSTCGCFGDLGATDSVVGIAFDFVAALVTASWLFLNTDSPPISLLWDEVGPWALIGVPAGIVTLFGLLIYLTPSLSSWGKDPSDDESTSWRWHMELEGAK